MTTSDSPSTPLPRVRALPNSIHLVQTAAGSVLVNSPPETLKFLLAEELAVPKIILLPPDITPGHQLGSSGFVRHGIGYASVEFLLYSNFFLGKGQKTKLITVTADQARRLRLILEETIDGPSEPEVYSNFAWLQRECAAVGYYPPLKRAPNVNDLAEIVALETGGGDLGAGVQIRRAGDRFVFTENGADVASVSTHITANAMPLMMTPPYPVSRHELTLQFIGGSDGFDPTGITTCFLAYLSSTGHSRATLFDVAAYLRVRLGSLGISASQISEVVLSHLHEDHMAGVPELLLMGETRVRLITSSIIYTSLLRVLSAMLAVPEGEAAKLFDFYALNPGHPLTLEGRRFDAIYAVHSIPTIAVRVNELYYSGDMRYDEHWFAELEQQGLLTAERRAELIHFAEGATVIVQDAGGGAIHTTLTPELLQSLTAKSQRLVFAHTSKHTLPTGQAEAASHVEFAESGHVTTMGASVPRTADADRIETLSACPLFTRLPIGDRAALASLITLTTWAPGQVIVREGDPSDGKTYVVHTGLVEVRMGGEPVRVIGRGTTMGERGALMGDVRMGTLIARGPVELLELGPEVFKPIAESLGLSAAFRRADWLSQHPTFSHLPWATLLDLALDFQPRQYRAGEWLFHFGEPGHECYLLISGTVHVIDKNNESLGDFSAPGEFFGGRAALYGTPRNASAQVLSPGEIWALPAPALHRLNGIYSNVLLHLRALEAKRLGEKPLISVLGEK